MAQQVLTARQLYDAYPGSEGLTDPPEDGESIEAYVHRAQEQITNCGDTLFAFVFLELMDCGHDIRECRERVDTARCDLDAVDNALQELEMETT